MIFLETVLIVLNAVGAAAFFAELREDWYVQGETVPTWSIIAVKLVYSNDPSHIHLAHTLDDTGH